MHCRVFVGIPEGQLLLGRPRCGRSKSTLMDLKPDGRAWTGFTGLRIGTPMVGCEHGKEPYNSIKCGEFLTS